MAMLEISPKDALYFEHNPPTAPDGHCFVFVNPITGDCSLWENVIAPALRDAGHGTLIYNFRGQAHSTFSPDLALDDTVIIDDLARIIDAEKPKDPILVGLSIGGLYAARAYLKGVSMSGLVLINTLRIMSPRIDWMNRLCLRLMKEGGMTLLRDSISHVLTGPATHGAMLSDIFDNPPTYEPMAEDTGFMNLVTWMGQTSWELDYSQLDLPVLVMTGYQDRVFYDAADVNALFDTLPDAYRLDLPHAGHMIPAERPQETVMGLIGFARTV